MHHIAKFIITTLIIATTTVCCTSGQSGMQLQKVYNSANDIAPLQPGTSIPDVPVINMEGSSVKLRSVLQSQPTVLVFFRGGWCPFCRKHFAQLQTIEEDLRLLGFQIIAVTTDRYEKLQTSVDAGQLNYTLLSDNDMYAASAFGIAFKVDDATIEKYKGFNINLDESSGRSHHLLPVPTVLIVDSEGIIRFTHSNSDYKVRLSPEQIMAAAGKIR